MIAVCTLVFWLELVGGPPFIYRWAAIPADIAQGRHPETLLSSMFMHASWSHIIGNMLFLWVFGPQIEDTMGRMRYALFYLAGGVISMLAEIASGPGVTLPCLGASGAIAAVMGAFLVIYPTDQIRTLLFFGWIVRVAFIPAIVLIGVWFLTQLISLGVVAEAQEGGVAYMAHVSGAAFGAIAAKLFAPVRRKEF